MLSLVTCLTLCSCIEETVVSNHPFLAGVPGAVTGRPVTPIKGASTPEEIDADKLIRTTPDGKKELISKTGRQLMVHIYNTLKDDDVELFVDQVLSERTKQEFYERGYDPREAFKELHRRQDDLDALFAMIPMGEATPGALARNVGHNTIRIEVTGMGARGLKWSGMDIAVEKGNYRLRWFVDGPAGEE